MGLKVIKLGFWLLCSLCFHHQLWLIAQADAFLFHQLKPATLTKYSSNQGNLSAPAVLESNQQIVGNHRQSGTQQTQTDQKPTSYSAQDSNGATSDETQIKRTDGCPVECDCNRAAQIADCSNRNLVGVPIGFPKDIKRIRLERNNISELGAYAFNGLKRLQRIDLSNNNLVKIDPLAFSGGLQSLNSLILYSNKLNQLPVNVFRELNQLQLLLLNANSLQCINVALFRSLTNLNLLSLYDNNIETLTNGTFDGLKNIKTIHLGKNPLICDCNLRWLADYLEVNPIETSEARCEGPARNQAKKLSQLSKQKFTCEANEQAKTNQISGQCASSNAPATPDQSCPAGCVCSGATVDCSRSSLTESRTGGGIYELPEIPDDVPVYVTRMRINDNRIKRIRQTGLFRRLANSQKLDLGNNKIIDIEDNAINGAGAAKPERIVFVLVENEHCSSSSARQFSEDACASAPKVNSPTFDSPCYNGGSCLTGNSQSSYANYSCLCPPGFAGPLCEINIDDCAEHQCQNGAMCVDAINSYRCVCRDPTTSGEFCEQLNPVASSPSNSIAPIALPMIAANPSPSENLSPPQQQSPFKQQMLVRSADFAPISSAPTCKRITQRKYYDDGNGCQSVRVLKLSECSGTCACCAPAKVKRRRIRMQCNDGATYVKTVDLVKRCACSSECSSDLGQQQRLQQATLGSQFNATQEDQILQITRLDAVD